MAIDMPWNDAAQTWAWSQSQAAPVYKDPDISWNNNALTWKSGAPAHSAAGGGGAANDTYPYLLF